MSTSDYQLHPDGIFRHRFPINHRNDEYDEVGFETLWKMQTDHFWYRGRHRFLLGALDQFLPKAQQSVNAIDLGEE